MLKNIRIEIEIFDFTCSIIKKSSLTSWLLTKSLVPLKTMNHMKKIILIFILASAKYSSSQNYLGVASSNYAGVMGTDIQPASFVDGRLKFDMNLYSVNFSAYQNLGYFNAAAMRDAQGGKGYWWDKSFGDSAIYKNWSQPSESFMDRFVVRNYDQNSDNTLGINTNLQMELLNFMVHIRPKIAVGFTAKLRSITNIDNIDPKLAVLAEKGLEYPNLWNLKLNEELLNINHLTWLEYGFNYSQVIYDKSAHFLKVGGRLKYLAGLAAAYLYTENFSYNLLNEDTSKYLSGDFAYGYSSNFDQYAEGNFDGISKRHSKLGIGTDFGVVYEWRPNWKKHQSTSEDGKSVWSKDQNKYKARLGFSILDIGAMQFQKGGLSRDFSINANFDFDLTRFESVTSVDEFDQIIDSLINQSQSVANFSWKALEKPAASFNMSTPTALSLQADFHVWKWFYVNATGILNMTSAKRATKVKIPNQLSFTASFDHSRFGIYVPISMNTYSGFKMGLATRLGPLTFGVTDFNSLFAIGNVRGVEFFAGFRLPIQY
jgi:hypothetical protein